MIGSKKAASIYTLLGENLPMEVFEHLSSEEIEKLLLRLEKKSELNSREETKILQEFVKTLRNRKTPKSPSPAVALATKRSTIPKTESASSPAIAGHGVTYRQFSDHHLGIEESELLDDILGILDEETKKSNTPCIEMLETMAPSEVAKLIVDEPASIIAQILYFCPKSTSQELVPVLPSAIREEVIWEFAGLDFHSTDLRDELERFVRFKLSLIQSPKPQKLRKWKGREGKKAAELLSILNPGESEEILTKIQKKRPQFAENIIEHYYSFKDLLSMGRTSLSQFLGSHHPLVVATALKGVEIGLKEEILAGVEPWIAKKIRLECDSLGYVSLAEIEETHRGILDALQEDIEEGKIKLWRFR